MPCTSKHFFIPVVHDPLRAVGHVTALMLSPWGGGVRSHETRGSTIGLPCREARPGVEGHVAAPEPISSKSRGSRAEGHVAALELASIRMRGSGAERHMAVPEPTSPKRRILEPRGMWQLVVAHLALCLVFLLVRGGT
jgi:hypothetical protein